MQRLDVFRDAAKVRDMTMIRLTPQRVSGCARCKQTGSVQWFLKYPYKGGVQPRLAGLKSWMTQENLADAAMVQRDINFIKGARLDDHNEFRDVVGKEANATSTPTAVESRGGATRRKMSSAAASSGKCRARSGS